jgi:hypothetical protein
VFHGIDVALLLLGLAACALAALPLVASGLRPPFAPAHALTACGAILTTIVLIFLDTSSARTGAFLGLLASLAVLGGGLLLGAGGGRAPVEAPPPSAAVTTPPPGWYPDPQRHARLRYWDGTAWSDATSE